MLKIIGSSDLAKKNNDDKIVENGGDEKNLSKSKNSKNIKSRIQTHIKSYRKTQIPNSWREKNL